MHLFCRQRYFLPSTPSTPSILPSCRHAVMPSNVQLAYFLPSTPSTPSILPSCRHAVMPSNVQLADLSELAVYKSKIPVSLDPYISDFPGIHFYHHFMGRQAGRKGLSGGQRVGDEQRRTTQQQNKTDKGVSVVRIRVREAVSPTIFMGNRNPINKLTHFKTSELMIRVYLEHDPSFFRKF